MDYQPASFKPDFKYALKFYDFSVTEIGIRDRTAIQLEKQLKIVTVRDLANIRPSLLLDVDNLGEVMIREVMQCMANIGLPVSGFLRQRGRTPKPPQHRSVRYGLPEDERYEIYVP